MKYSIQYSISFLFAAFLLFFLSTFHSEAVVHYVTSVNDDGYGSLREVVAEADDGDEIEFSVTHIFLLSPIEIDKNLTISGFSPTNKVPIIGSTQKFVINGSYAITLKNMIFEGGNVSNNGSAIWLSGGSLSLNNCIIANNITTGTGRGAVYINDGSLTAIYCEFSENTAAGGAAVFMQNSIFNATECFFYDNTNVLASSITGGGVHLRGSSFTANYCQFVNNSGRIGSGVVVDISSIFNANHCQFLGNTTPLPTGHNGGAVAVYNNSTFNVYNCIFKHNESHQGAAIFVTNSSNLNVNFCTFDSNHSIFGAIRIAHYSTANLNNSQFHYNSSDGTNNAGAVLSMNTHGSVTATNCSFTSNHMTGLTGFGDGGVASI